MIANRDLPSDKLASIHMDSEESVFQVTLSAMMQIYGNKQITYKKNNCDSKWRYNGAI